ncbi:MAG: heavy metal translocating P-type ATPase [Lawsonibacter sp.]|jgi:Cd2+/Zn2+-exporting ATPase
MTKKWKHMLVRVLVSAAIFLLAQFVGVDGMQALALYLAAYGIVGWDVLWRAARNLCTGQVFDENFLMAVATVGAFGCGEYPEGVAVMLFYQIGELFQNAAVARSRQSIANLMDIRPDYAFVERENTLVQVEPESVAVGDVIVVKPGERVALDGVVVEGNSALDTAALTGESLPRDVVPGQHVVSGCVNLTGVLRIQVEKAYEDSTVSRILELVESSAAQKAKAEHFITKFARVYTPAVVFAACALAVIPPLVGAGPFSMWIQRALIFLVVSCPCALVISIPLSFFGGIGGASRQGILVKGGNYLEALAKTGIVVFDKTGTLTKGTFSVVQLVPYGMTEEELLEWTAYAEGYSTHPLAASIRAAWNKPMDLTRVAQVEEVAGRGVQATVDGRTVLTGSQALLQQFGIPTDAPREEAGTVIHLAVDGVYAGYLRVSDQVKEEAISTLQGLKDLGVRKTVMLTGDSTAAGEAVGRILGVDEVYAQLMPQDKVERVEQLLQQKRPGEQLVFVGDGINDAPVLSRADLGVAMGAMGSDAAIEAADIVLMDDDLQKLPVAVSIARKTMRIVRENIVFALGIKFLVLALSAVGLANMWMAVFADVGVSVLAIANASRMLAGVKNK